ncbi:hypothetical protein BTJ40_13615 [Microbulbifer sp. A4B17]|nr:hypothetical protein BTJ40_13615 [Microbulbifer sp. A4B17]
MNIRALKFVFKHTEMQAQAIIGSCG